ncbi:MAG: hypothetical protein BroJett022_19520 [Actinomycetes bacterium]|nr:MAG: hypothetical protein BroJett022_19520 [Actinomycetes bacterium]
MVTVAVADERSPSRCEHCGHHLDESAPASRTGSGSIESRVRERLYGRQGLGRRLVRR